MNAYMAYGILMDIVTDFFHVAKDVGLTICPVLQACEIKIQGIVISYLIINYSRYFAVETWTIWQTIALEWWVYARYPPRNHNGEMLRFVEVEEWSKDFLSRTIPKVFTPTWRVWNDHVEIWKTMVWMKHPIPIASMYGM